MPSSTSTVSGPAIPAVRIERRWGWRGMPSRSTEVIQDFGSGALSGFKFGKVVLTGASRAAGSGLAGVIADVVPVDADPVLSTQNDPADYITFRAGTLASLFFNPATSIPSVIATNGSVKGVILGDPNTGHCRSLSTTAPGYGSGHRDVAGSAWLRETLTRASFPD